MDRFAFLIILLVLSSCKDSETGVVQNQHMGTVFGTTYSIIFQTGEIKDLQKQIDSVFGAVNQSLSTYIPSSDISKINEGDTTIVVDHMFQDVFNLSKEIYLDTQGYFDPTVGVLVNAWGFGPGTSMEMDSTLVDSLLRYVGFNKVVLTPKNTVHKNDPGIKFDFNAIAKGYAIDRLAVMMDERKIADYLLEVGGEVVAKGGNRLKQKPWAVGIDDPQAVSGRALKTSIMMKDIALASSGNYRKFRTDPVTGMKFVHTVDPLTGFTKNGTTLAATVLASTCAKADGYATAFMAMDLQKVRQMLTNHTDLDAYIIYLDENGQTQEFMTNGFKGLVLGPQE